MEHEHIRKVVIRTDETIELISESDQVVILNVLAEERGTDVNRRTYTVTPRDLVQPDSSTDDLAPLHGEDTVQGADGQPLNVGSAQ